MRFQSRKHHIIDILFPISLYFVFTVSALTVLLLATNVYRTTTENSALNFNANISLSYITEKIHQNDTEGAVSIGSFDGHQALILKQHYNDTEYVTYIYVSEGNLMELYTKSSADVRCRLRQSHSAAAVIGYGDVSIGSPAFDMYRCAGTHRCVLYQHPQ